MVLVTPVSPDGSAVYVDVGGPEGVSIPSGGAETVLSVIVTVVVPMDPIVVLVDVPLVVKGSISVRVNERVPAKVLTGRMVTVKVCWPLAAPAPKLRNPAPGVAEAVIAV